jgi:hypothetical protein
MSASLPRLSAAIACAAALGLSCAAPAAYSRASHEQIAWVRRAATNFVNAELSADGAGACTILNAPLRATLHHRTCAQRWDARLARLLREPGAKARLRAQRRAIASATVTVHGDLASIRLAAPLLDRTSRFLWTENCWMLEG